MLVDIYNKLLNSGIPWAKLEPIGWNKVHAVAKVLTAENADHWIEVAKTQNCPTLIETVKAYIAHAADPALTDETSKTIVNKHFKLHADQSATVEAALEKAKEASGTDVGAVALNYICLDFLGGQTLAQLLKTIDPTAIGTAIKQAFGDNKQALAAIVGAVA